MEHETEKEILSAKISEQQSEQTDHFAQHEGNPERERNVQT